MSKKIKNQIFIVFNIIFLCIIFNMKTFASMYTWVGDPSNNKWLIIDNDSIVKNKVILDDIDGDGIGYYYYVDNNGYVLMDTICPDYHIVDKEGRRLDKYGNVESKQVRLTGLDGGQGYDDSIIPELYNQYVSGMDTDTYVYGGDISVGVLRQNESLENNIGPNLFIQETVSNGEAGKIIGKGVVFKEKTEKAYDSSIDPDAKLYLKSGNSYSKSVNGTTYSKAKWKGVMALKGSGAYIDFENTKNNFNKISGRIATHHFTYSDRTTICTLHIFDDYNNEVYSTTDFNYNGGTRFTATFPKKSEFVRLELTVDGQYTTRTAYLRDVKFGFDREAWADEQEEDAQNIGRENLFEEAAREQREAEEEAMWDALADEDTEIDEDGYTKSDRRYISTRSNVDDDSYDYDDTDADFDPDNLRANESDKKSGPSFDQALQEEAKRKANQGPGFVGITID